MIKEHLTKTIGDYLPGGRLVPTMLPQCDAISLYLLNSDFHNRGFSMAQTARLLDEPMFWVFCWASGQAMARHIMENPELVEGKRVLDFGCGSGVAAIAAAKAGAAAVWACDLDPCAIDATRLNAQLNSVSIQVIRDWETCKESWDMILVADVLYDRKNFPLLEQFTARSREVLVADSRVANFNAPFYRKTAELNSFTIPDLGEPEEFGRVNMYYASLPL